MDSAPAGSVSGAEASAPRYCAFISYSHQDKAWAQWLHAALEAYAIPKEFRVSPERKRLGKVFRDEAELASAADLSETIQTALAQSDALIVIASPAAARSPWVNQEILAFKRLGRAARVFCLIVEGEPFAGDAGQEERECFPPALRYAYDPEKGLSDKRQEPLGVDARKDGKRDGLLRLAAGLLDLGFDDLKRREQHRRQRQLAVIAAGSLLGMAIASGLAWYAYAAKLDAEAQRQHAEREARIARETTDFLISLFQNVDPFRNRGNEVSAREVLDSGVQRIQSAFKDAPEIKASLMGSMAEVYQGLGQYEQSDRLLKPLELTRSSPLLDANQRLRLLNTQAQTRYLVGDYAAAETLARSASALVAQEAGHLSPFDMARTQNIAAELAIQNNDETSALRLLKNNESLLSNANEAEKLEAARTKFNMGYLHFLKKRYPEAHAAFSQSRDLRQAVFGPEHPWVSEAENALATTDYRSGAFLEAEARWKKILPLYRRYFGEQHPEYAALLQNYALSLLERGEFATAKMHYAHVLAIFRKSKAADHDDLAFLLNSLGLAELGLNKLGQARAYWEEGLGIARRHKHRMRAPLLLNLAELDCREGHAERSQPLLAEAEQANAEDYAGIAWRAGQLETVKLFCRARLGEAVPAQAFEAGIAAIEAHWGKARLYTQAARWRQARAAPATLKEAPATKP